MFKFFFLLCCLWLCIALISLRKGLSFCCGTLCFFLFNNCSCSFNIRITFNRKRIIYIFWWNATTFFTKLECYCAIYFEVFICLNLYLLMKYYITLEITCSIFCILIIKSKITWFFYAPIL
jgi:hypothetical protein